MEFLKKNGFWIVSFLLVVAMVGTFFYASGALDSATAKRVSAIKSANTSAAGILKVEAEPNTKSHPNQSTEEGMQVKLDNLTQSVLVAWQKRYDAQKEILKWPERDLKQGFMDEFAQYTPPETWPEDNKGDSVLMKNLLDVYKLQVPKQMDRICKIIQTNWEHQEELTRASNNQSGDDKADDDEDGEQPEGEQTTTDEFLEEREIVKWSSNNQTLWLNKLTKFRGHDDNEFTINRPSPSQVFMLQQDLWLLEAMFEIIRNVNARMEDGKKVMGPDDKPVMVQANDLAVIKELDHVVFGREALAYLGEIQDTLEGGAAGGGKTRSKSSSRTRSKKSDAELTYLGEPAWHGRYVDPELKPIQAATIKKVFSEKKLPSDNLELVVAKRVPVRLAVKMDEREIPRFLAECANSPFAFEVWQVRINKHDPEESIKRRGNEGGTKTGGRGGQKNRRGGGVGAGGVGAGGGFGGGSGGLGNSTGRGGTGKLDSSTVALRKNFDVRVEFYGIVKIYNPVNEELITGEKPVPPAAP